jgi:hypothetical protein
MLCGKRKSEEISKISQRGGGSLDAGDRAGGKIHLGSTGVGFDIRTSAAASELLQKVCDGNGRRPRLKRILGHRARAFEMPQNSVDSACIRNKRYDAHAAAAPTQQRVRLEAFLNQASLGAAGFPGAVRIVALKDLRCRRADGFGPCRPQANPAAVAVCAIESLTIA